MSYILGESVQMGVGNETTRGTAVSPTDFIPARTASNIQKVVEKTIIKEGRATKYGSYGTEITHARGEGELEFNVKSRTFGYFLKSLLGTVSSATKAGETVVYEHTFGILTGTPQNPTITIGLSQQGFQDYAYNGAMVTKLELEAPIDDVVKAKASFISRDETEVSDYTVAFANDDHYFRNYDFKVKMADTLGGLTGATPIALKEFKLSLANNSKANHVISSITPDDVLAGLAEIGGSMTIDYTDKANYDAYKNNTAKYMQIEMTNTSETIGTSANPKIVITLYRVSLTSYKADRPLDEIVTEQIEFNAHYSQSDAKAIQVVLTNTKATY